jgi:tight adherence protein C
MIQIIVIAALSVIVFCITVLLLIAVFVRPSKEAQRTLDIVAGSHPERPVLNSRERFQEGLLSIAQEIRSRLGFKVSENSVERLSSAGFRDSNSVDFYFAAQLLLPLIFALLACFIRQNTLIWALCLAFVGYVIPDLWLSSSVRRRRKKIRSSLPDMIDLLVICVDAGLGLDQAVLRVSDEISISHPEIKEELTRMHLEQKAGRPRLETWQNLAARTQVPELTSLTNILTQADRFGTPITRALSGFADDIRERYRQRVEEAAAETKIKIVFPLVFCIFPCLFIVLLGPAFLTIVHGLKSIVQ